MKDYFKNNVWKAIAVLLVILILVPFSIHLLFKIHPLNSFFSAEWSAGDLLLFYGAILAALGTMIGVFLTLKYSHENYKEDSRKRVLPFIAPTVLRSKSRYNAFADILKPHDEKLIESTEDGINTIEPVYDEYELDSVYFIVEKDSIDIEETLPDKYIKLLEQRGEHWEKDNNLGEVLVCTPFLSLPILLENVGNGTAINLRIGFYKTNEKPKYIEPKHINQQQRFYLHIFVPDARLIVHEFFTLSLVYEDIYSNKYCEEFPVNINNKSIAFEYAIKQVKLLTTQYRSVPDIGYVFSNFVYGGILNHNRTSDSQRPLNAGNDLGIETLNIIKFPVKKYESIYRCKRLQHKSSYQVYSALFTFEYVCYLSRAIAENNPGKSFNIGIIAPYRAQADMIDKLLASEKLPEKIDVQVGTIHGFQGDECDIIFAVFNTPPTISASAEMFLNKRNIINVSISRARDYLFIVMPDDNTENIENLRLVKRVEGLIQSTDAWNEFASTDLEDLMFDDPNYLEKNAFSTSHQSVNVYGLPEKKYEIRAEDAAVDVQIHRLSAENTEGIESEQKEHHRKGIDDYVDSYDLDETVIPEELREEAIDLPAKGALKGWCYLVPYEGKLRDHTAKDVVGMFIPLIRNGQEKMVSVSVALDDRIIYISSNMFKLYEQSLSDPDGIELKRTF